MSDSGAQIIDLSQARLRLRPQPSVPQSEAAPAAPVMWVVPVLFVPVFYPLHPVPAAHVG
jgi:hypothetical protein